MATHNNTGAALGFESKLWDMANQMRGLWPFLAGFVPDSLRPRLLYLTVQQVVQAIEATGRHSWISDFKEIYAIT